MSVAIAPHHPLGIVLAGAVLVAAFVVAMAIGLGLGIGVRGAPSQIDAGTG